MYMWSPHNIGRESWVWEEQEALYIVNSPPQGGGRSPRRVDPLVGRTAERPLGKMVVVVVVATAY